MPNHSEKSRHSRRRKHAEKLVSFQMPEALRKTINDLSQDLNDEKSFGRELFPYEIVSFSMGLLSPDHYLEIKKLTYDEMDLLKEEHKLFCEENEELSFGKWLLARHEELKKVEKKKSSKPSKNQKVSQTSSLPLTS